jgi:HEAT repeat protein
VQAIELINDRDPGVRRAAVEALRGSDSAAIAASLWAMVRLGGDDGTCAMRALAELGFAPTIEADVLAGLTRMAPQTQQAALAFLREKRKTLVDPAPVAALARDLTVSGELRARALYCLEQTGSFETDQAGQMLFFLEPLERHFVARCLLEKGDPRGVDVLCELVDSDADDARTASLRLLAWLGGVSPTSDTSRLREAAKQALHGPRKLPETDLFRVLGEHPKA